MRLGDLVAVTHRVPPPPAAPTAARAATPPAAGALAAASPTPPPQRPSLSRSPARAVRARSPPFPRHPAPRTGRHSPERLADPRHVARHVVHQPRRAPASHNTQPPALSRRMLQRDIPAVGTKPSLRAAAVVLDEGRDAEPTQRR